MFDEETNDVQVGKKATTFIVKKSTHLTIVFEKKKKVAGFRKLETELQGN